MPGLKFKPVPPAVKFKEVKAKRRKVESKTQAERARKLGKAERKKRRADRLQRRADRREEEKHRRAESGETLVTKAKSKRDPKSHHGTESVDTTILKLLGKSRKSKKVAAKSKKNLGEKKKVERVEAKWKPGMRNEAREGWQEERKLRKKAEAERCSKKETTTGSTMPKTSDSKSFVEDILSELVTNLPVSGEKKVLHWSPNRSTKEKETTDLASKVQSEPKIVEEKQGGEAEVHQIEPMPPCMVFYQVNRKQVTISLTQIHGYYFFSFFTVIEFSPVQVHADHLCTPEAHLGSWPVPPQNSILVPPSFSPCQIAQLLDRQKPLADSSADLTDSLASNSGSDERVVLEDMGPDLEADLYWDPYKAASSNYDEEEAKRDTEREEEEQRRTERGEPEVTKVEILGMKENSSSNESEEEKQYLTSSPSSGELMDEPVKRKSKKYVKRRVKETRRRTEDSSDEEGEEPKQQRRRIVTDRRSHSLLFFGSPLKERSQPANGIPGIYLTESSDNEEIPNLTADSDEDQEPEVPNNADHLGNDDLQGGGAGGSNNHFWLNLAMRIMEGVTRAQLPLRLPLDDITEGDGNCYFRALCSQLQRPEVAAPGEITQLDHRSLRKAICNFMLKSRLPVVKDFKQRWMEFCLGNYDQYWRRMAESRGNIWAEGPVIHASAWFLERDIYVVSEKATLGDPFLPFSGNQDGTERACAGAALWLGHLTGLHYQTLMPRQSESMPPRPNLRKVEDTLQAKAQATVKGGDQQSSQPGISKASGVGKVSLIHSQ